MSMVNTLIKLGFSNSLVTSCLFLLLLLALALFLHYKFYVYDDRFTELASKIPGPKWYPFIGSAYGFGRDPAVNLQIWIDTFEKNNYPVTKYWLGPMLFVGLSKAKDIEAILSSNTLLTKATAYHLMGPLAEGLVGNSGETWKRHRKALRNGFSYQALENSLPIFNAKAKILTEMLDTLTGKQRFNIYPLVVNCVYDIIHSVLLSRDSNEQVNAFGKEAYFPSVVKECGVTLMHRMFQPWLYPDGVFYLTSRGKAYQSGADYGLNLVQEVLDKKKEELKLQSGENITNKKSESKTKHTFLSHVMENVLNKDLSEDEVVKEIVTIMVAGMESSMATISIIICILSRRFDIQEKIVEEILQVLGTLEEKDVTSEDVQNFTYLDRVVKECMRLMSVVPFTAREITHEVTLPSGYTLPKWCTVAITTFHIHRDPDIYPDPDVFDPDHFLPERVAARPSYSYIPFSAGPRDCIGKKFANMEMKITLINILRKFWITPTDDVLALSGRLVLCPMEAVYVGLKTRTADRPVIAKSEKLATILPSNLSSFNVYFKDSYI